MTNQRRSIAEIKAELALRLSQKATSHAPDPAPRYDDVFCEGVQALDKLGEAGASKDFALWVNKNPTLALRARDMLTPEELRACIKAAPGRAMSIVPELMTDEEFDQGVQIAPMAALMWSSRRLTDKQLAYCVEKVPGACLLWAWDRLTDKQFQSCVERQPAVALHKPKTRLTDEQIDYCVKKAPGSAVIYAKELLTEEQLDYCARARPHMRRHIEALRTDVGPPSEEEVVTEGKNSPEGSGSSGNE